MASHNWPTSSKSWKHWQLVISACREANATYQAHNRCLMTAFNRPTVSSSTELSTLKIIPVVLVVVNGSYPMHEWDHPPFFEFLTPSRGRGERGTSADNVHTCMKYGVHALLRYRSIFRHNLFLSFLFDKFDYDCVLQTLFCSRSDAIRSVWTVVANHVFWLCIHIVNVHKYVSK